MKDSPVFRNNFSDFVIQQTVSTIEQIKFLPEEYIYVSGKVDDLAIYFIEKGKVDITLTNEQNELPIWTLTKG